MKFHNHLEVDQEWGAPPGEAGNSRRTRISTRTGGTTNRKSTNDAAATTRTGDSSGKQATPVRNGGGSVDY